jgi:copper chaperone CopZ
MWPEPTRAVLYTREGYTANVTETTTYTVPAIHCEHCALSIREEVSEVPGVETVEVDLDTKSVTVAGDDVSDDLVRAAIVEAGYEAA